MASSPCPGAGAGTAPRPAQLKLQIGYSARKLVIALDVIALAIEPAPACLLRLGRRRLGIAQQRAAARGGRGQGEKSAAARLCRPLGGLPLPLLHVPCSHFDLSSCAAPARARARLAAS